MRLAFVLAEDRLGHYSEFRAFFVRTFDLDRVGLAGPGYVRAPSGTVYAAALEPIDETVVDGDLWSILRWMIEGVGGEWTTDAMTATGRLFRIPVSTVPDRAAL